MKMTLVLFSVLAATPALALEALVTCSSANGSSTTTHRIRVDDPRYDTFTNGAFRFTGQNVDIKNSKGQNGVEWVFVGSSCGDYKFTSSLGNIINLHCASGSVEWLNTQTVIGNINGCQIGK